MRTLLLAIGLLFAISNGNSQGFVSTNPDTVFAPCTACPGASWSWNPATNPAPISSYPFNTATVLGTPEAFSDELQFRDYDLSIPSNAIITGYEVVLGQMYGGGTSIRDSVIKLTVNGVATGQNKAISSNWISPSNTVTYGSPSDTWGLNLTPAIINNHQIGISVRITSSGIVTGGYTQALLRVYYSVPCTYEFTWSESTAFAFQFNNTPNVFAPQTISWSVNGGPALNLGNDPFITLTTPSLVCMTVIDSTCINGPVFQHCDSVIPASFNQACNYDFTFTETSPGQFSFNNTPNVNAPGTIQWSINYGGGGTQFANTNDPNHIITLPAQVCMLVFDPGCSNGPSFLVCDSVIPGAGNTNCSVDLGSDITAISNCTAQMLNASVTGTTGTVSYSWTASNGITLYTPTAASTGMTAAGPGSAGIFVSITDGAGCTATDMINVNFIGIDTTFTFNTCTFPYEICTLDIPTNGPISWSWTDSTGTNQNASGNCLNVTEPGSYQLFTVYSMNCTVIHTYEVIDSCSSAICNGTSYSSPFEIPDSAAVYTIPGSFSSYTNMGLLNHNGSGFTTMPVWVSNGGTQHSNGVFFHDFDFSLPANAVITGIEIMHTHGGMNSNTYVIDSVFIMNAGQILGTVKRDSTSNFSTDTLGGDGDLWNAAVNPAMVNSSDFGFMLYSTMVGMGGTYGQFDFRAKIHYCLDSITSVSENIIDDQLTLFPNPASENIFIRFESGKTGGVEIFDMTGKLIKTQTNFISGNAINISDIENGIYLIRISVEGTHYTGKIIKN